MELLVQRDPSTDGVTIGKLYVDGVFECFVLEDQVREGPKVLHETAVPQGRYRVVITRSNRFQRMLPLLLDVPGFSGIRIHAGNFAVDTAGCLLVGQGRGVRSIIQSRLAMEALQPKIAGALARNEDVWITIENAPKEAAVRA